MLNEQKIAEEQVTTFAGHASTEDLAIGNSRVGIGIIMTLAGFLGTWGCVSLINGIAHSQNVQELGRGIITAFTGI